MATTFVDYTGDGNATKAFSFPSIKEADIKVEVDGVTKTTSTHYNITSYTTTGGGNVVFTSGNIPVSPALIRIYRDTDVDTAKATYTAGSSVKADDLNNNHEQLLFAAQEEQNQTIIGSDIKDGVITSAKITDGTIVAADLASNSVTTAKIADNAVTMAKLAGGTLPTDITVASANITDLSVATADIADDAVTADKIANSVNTAIAANTAKTTNQTHTGDVTGSVALTIANDAVTTAKIAADAVTTAKIADAELKVLAGMQGGTASKLADSTALTADIADLNQIDGMAKQTTITDDDAKFPTSGAVVDYVAAQLEPFGGFEAIANEVSFPNTQPASGVAISIADAAGIVVSGSGSSTTGRTVGGSTVTINGIPTNFYSSTIATGIRFIVTSTGSGQVYNYHKATLPESDLVSLSGDINDFNERYRVGSSNPTSNNDAGDLFFNTGTGKMMVFNGTSSAFEEVQSIGNFFLSTLSPAFNGSLQNFTLSNAPANVQQVILSINGVVQKPNAGTSTPSEGFALDGSTIKLASAPASGSDYFAVVMGSTVNIGVPSNNTVTTAILQNGSVTTAKLQDAGITAVKLQDASVTSAKLGNDSVVEAKIVDGNVTAAKLASNSVQAAKIADDAVQTAKIADTAITTAKIGNAQVTAAKLANTSVSAGSYGSATAIPAITVDAQGRITAASTNSINTSTIPVADESSDTTCFPVFVTAASGDLAPKSGSNLTFNSATGALGATSYTGDGSSLTGVASAVADGCIYENSQTISNNYTISTNKNALSAGPITIANGVTLTVPSGSVYTIV